MKKRRAEALLLDASPYPELRYSQGANGSNRFLPIRYNQFGHRIVGQSQIPISIPTFISHEPADTTRVMFRDYYAKPLEVQPSCALTIILDTSVAMANFFRSTIISPVFISTGRSSPKSSLILFLPLSDL